MMIMESMSRFLLLLSMFPSNSLDQQKYAAIFDAGSTGSRIHVFNFDGAMDLLHIGQDYEFYQAVEPGLSSYENDPNGAAESLRPLLEQGEAVVPEDLRSTTPLKLGVSDGWSPTATGECFGSDTGTVKEFFGKYSSLDYRPEWVTVLQGTDEGAYMWIALNYLLGSLGEVSETVGVIDLGGGSVQMAYAISENAASNAPPASPDGDVYVADRLILGANYYLYSHSYLNYGLQAARAQSLNLSKGNGNPCVTNGYQGTYEYNGEVYNVAPLHSGTNLRRCRALTRKMLKVDAPCSHNNCTFDGVWNGGGGDGLNTLYAASFFYDTGVESGIVEVDANSARVRPIVYRNAAKKACSANIDNIRKIFPQIDEGNVAFLCMDLVYEYTLLVDGLGISPFKEITVVKNVEYKGSPIGAAWPLGCAVELLSQ